MGISMKVKTKKKYGLIMFAIGNNDLDFYLSFGNIIIFILQSVKDLR